MNRGTNYAISPTEAVILQELLNGFSNKKIAEKLFCSPYTVKFHLQNLYYKTHTHTRIELCMKILYEIFGQRLTADLILDKFGKN